MGDVIPISQKPGDHRARVVIDPNEHRVTYEVVMALADSGRVFQRAGFLVEPRLDPARHVWKGTRPAEDLRMVAMGRTRVRSLAAEVCRFVKKEKAGEVDANVPDWLAPAVLSLPDWVDVPVVESVSENPTLRPDGTIHDVPGYDPQTGNYYATDESSPTFPTVPECPTREEARAAYRALVEPLCDFPFVSERDRSVAAAMALTLLARPAILGPTPPFAFRTPTPRTGKDLLTDVLTIIGTGRETPRRNLPKEDVELKKVLISLSLSGCRVAAFGNCEGAVGSPALSHAVTSEVMSDRLLGANTDVTFPLRMVWALNGNNLKFKSDFHPRVVVCDMDARVPDPQSRTEWTHDDVRAYARGIRPQLVAAGLTVLRAFCAAGKPRHGKPRKGSYERWDDLIRGAIVWVGAADPVESSTDRTSDDDADAERLRAVLGAWRHAFGAESRTLSDAVEAARDGGVSGDPARKARFAPLHAALAAVDPRLDERYSAASVGYYFRQHRGRPLDVRSVDEESSPETVLRLEVDNPRYGPSKVVTWYVLDGTVPVGSKPVPHAPPTPTPCTGPAPVPPSAPATPAWCGGSGGASLFDSI